MGCTAKVTMPLLSTLAALVIIVHTAEENYELSFREINPSIVEVEPHYDQSWRAVEVEPVMMHTTQLNQDGWSDASPDQPMRRRRRKRKRRPELFPQNEQQSQETQIFQNEPQDQQDTVEITRRRRKKVNYHDTGELNLPGPLTEEISNKPLRRRGHRRKRPVVEHRPELSEFSDHQHNRPDIQVKNKNTETQSTNVFENKNVNNEEGIIVEPEIQQDHKNKNFEEKITQVNIVDDKSEQEKYESYLPKDKSISEISSEIFRPMQTSNIPMVKTTHKTIDKNNDVNESQEKEPLDPVTLKALLKKSNGKSLSEILQQNNLSLSDLLHDKVKALSILQATDRPDIKETKQIELESNFLKVTVAPIDKAQSIGTDEKNEEASIINEVKHEHHNKEEENTDVIDCSTTETNVDYKENKSETTKSIKEDFKNSAITENKIKDNLRRRFPVDARRRLRMRPATNITNKVQNNRDLIMSTSLKYKNSRNISKSKEWKEVVATMLKRRPAFKEVDVESKSDSTKITTTIFAPEVTTTEEIFETTTDPSFLLTNTETTIYTDNDYTETLNTADSKIPNIIPEIPSPTVTTIEDEAITEKLLILEKTKISPILKPLVNSSELRRQAYNNRLKRKRLKQKVENTEEHEIKDIFGNSNFVSASEFIEKAQTRVTIPVNEDYTTLEDFMTTETVQNAQTTPIRSTKTSIKTTISSTEITPVPTEDSVKYEIEEILKDSMTSERLSKILKDRNMTLSELLEHRERGSSHVHLADIFHNASKEPNPPEPFLSKSLIEPISREIYPLRALLDANLHDPKTTIYDVNSAPTSNINIPVVMDFGNNVNENGENMGIISLFNNFSKINSEINMQNNKENKDEFDKIYSNHLNKNDREREGRTLSFNKDAKTWIDLITFMQKNHQKGNINVDTLETSGSPTYENVNNIKLEDIDNDGLIVLEDLENMKNFNSTPSSDELLDIKLYKNNKETPVKKPLESSLNSTTKSVTVATVTIIGLALTLFLLTYVVLKWKQRRVYHNKHSKEDECVPTPIFENRKSHKRNNSTRSKSPMISSNIYTVDSLDTRTGNESPEYMWDSLRKPFQ